MRAILTVILSFGFIMPILGQSFPALEKILLKNYPPKSLIVVGQWQYFPQHANIEKIEKPLVNVHIANYTFYKVNLTYYLGHGLEQAICLVLFDSSKSKILLVPPLWYGGIGKDFLSLFVNVQLESQDSLMSFIGELGDLMIVGSGFHIENDKYEETKITFDLSDMNRDKTQKIYRNLEITIVGNKILSFKSTNPKTGDETLVE